MCRSVRSVGASTLLALLALCVDARSQDKKPEEKKPEAVPVAAGQQDRIDIGAVLDSCHALAQSPIVRPRTPHSEVDHDAVIRS